MVSDLFPFIGEPGPSPETRQVSDRLYASTVSLRVRFPRYDRCISLLVHKVCIPVLYSIELFDSRSCSLLVYPILSPFHFIRIHSYAFLLWIPFVYLIIVQFSDIIQQLSIHFPYDPIVFSWPNSCRSRYLIVLNIFRFFYGFQLYVCSHFLLII